MIHTLVIYFIVSLLSIDELTPNIHAQRRTPDEKPMSKYSNIEKSVSNYIKSEHVWRGEKVKEFPKL